MFGQRGNTQATFNFLSGAITTIAILNRILCLSNSTRLGVQMKSCSRNWAKQELVFATDSWDDEKKDFLRDNALCMITRSHRIGELTSEVQEACQELELIQVPTPLKCGTWLISSGTIPTLPMFYLLDKLVNNEWLDYTFGRNYGSKLSSFLCFHLFFQFQHTN